ncbi:MAG TPA: hypothetical protein VGE62_03980 [Candidatus Paceibacterota bacterium]
MPDPKKAAKPSGGGSSWEKEALFTTFVFIMILVVIAPTVASFFGFGGTADVALDSLGERISDAFATFLETLSVISIFMSFVIVLAIAYAKMGYKEVMDAFGAKEKNAEALMQRPAGSAAAAAMSAPAAAGGPGFSLPGQEGFGSAAIPVQQPVNPKWEQIERLIASPNQAEWRVAILEADILLYDMLSQMGYPGNTIGEMLKQADESSFVTLQDAWKAHVIRNTIAHEGADYILTRGEAERAIRLFKRVFDEFYFI